MSAAPTRRRLLQMGAGAAALGIAPAAAMAASATGPKALNPGVIRPAFLAAEQRFRRLERRATRYDRLVLDPALQRLRAAEAAVPHVTLERHAGIPGQSLTTERSSAVQFARGVAADPSPLHRSHPEVQKIRTFLAGAIRRERTLARLPERAIADRVYERDEALGQASVAAEDDFYAMPVQSLAELERKVRVLIERGNDDDGNLSHSVLPALLTLTGREGEA